MLVLSRQRDETIMIGDHIEVTVVDVRGDKVRLGINAPTSVAVHRKEVYEAIRRENLMAAQMDHSQIDSLSITQPASGIARSVRGPAGTRGAIPGGKTSIGGSPPAAAARPGLSRNIISVKPRNAS